MFHFDHVIVMAINRYSQHSWIFDRAITYLQGMALLKGEVFMAAFWWVWFSQNGQDTEKRNILIVTLAGALLAMALARGLQLVLPFQMVPASDPAIAFRIPYGITFGMETWSSFPSDHASLFASLTTGFWLVSRRLGLAAATYIAVIIMAPRIYCGLHYPSDELAGCLVGITSILLVKAVNDRKPLFAWVSRWYEKQPGSFYALAFIFTLQVATLFDELRHLGSGIIKVFHGPGF